MTSTSTLRIHLRELVHIDERRVLVIRKFKGFGLDAADVLRDHFSGYGEVEKVYLTHSYVRSTRHNGFARLRPSSPVFLVMTRAEDAYAILRDGVKQQVQGVALEVHPFSHRGVDETDETALPAN